MSFFTHSLFFWRVEVRGGRRGVGGGKRDEEVRLEVLCFAGSLGSTNYFGTE